MSCSILLICSSSFSLMRRVLQARLGVCFARCCPVGGVGDSVDGSSAGQPAGGSAGRRRPASGWGEKWIAVRYACLAKARGRRVVVSCRQNRQLARRQSGFKCLPRLTGRILWGGGRLSDAHLHQRRLLPTMMLGSVTTQPLEAVLQHVLSGRLLQMPDANIHYNERSD